MLNRTNDRSLDQLTGICSVWVKCEILDVGRGKTIQNCMIKGCYLLQNSW